MAIYIYISTSSKHEIQEVFNHEAAKSKNTSIIKLANNFNNQLQIPEEGNEIESNENHLTKNARLSRKRFVKKVLENYERSWKENIRAGRLKQELDKEYIKAQGSFKLIKAGILQYDSERIVHSARPGTNNQSNLTRI